MGMLIAFSGVDCSGKSTQIELLRQHFVSRGRSCAVFWYRPGYSPQLGACKSFLRGVAAVVRGREAHAAGGPFGAVAGSGGGVRSIVARTLWVTSALADSFVQWAAWLRILMARNDVVICDRYYWDGVLDLQCKFSHSGWAGEALRIASALFPRPDRALMLWISPEEMAARAAAKAEPFPDTDDVREFRRRTYEGLRSSPQFVTIDASGTVMQTHQAILRAIELVSGAQPQNSPWNPQ